MPGRPSASGPGNVTWTLCLLNGQLLAGNAVCNNPPNSPNDTYPGGVAWDSQNGYLYVANIGYNTGISNVSVINGVTDAVVGSVPVGSMPWDVAYDNGNGYLYVTNENSNSVSVINGVTDAVVGSIPVGVNPYDVAYDRGNGYLYVTNENSNSVSVINGVTDAVVGSVPVGSNPQGVAYDSGNGYLYVANSNCSSSPCGQGNVSVINGVTDAVVGSIPVGIEPESVAYDSGNGYLYVTNTNCTTGSLSTCGQSNVSVINGVTDAVVGSIPVGVDPYGVAYDGGNGYLYVTNGGWSVSIITNGPQTISSVTVIPSSDTLKVGTYANFTATPSCPGGPCSGVTYTWSLNNTALGSLNVTSGSSVKFTTSASGVENLSVVATLNGQIAKNSSIITITTTYMVTFSESGLPSGTSWTATFNGNPKSSTTSAITFSGIANGAYPFSVSTPVPGGSGIQYVGAPASGTITVSGSNVSQAVIYTTQYQLTTSVNPASGGTISPSTGNWYNGGTPVPVSATANPGYTFQSFTGTGLGSYSGSNNPASVTMNGPVSEVANFQAATTTYTVPFSESGLPTGTNWTVTLAGQTLSSTTGPITFHEPNGTYSFTVGSVPGYTANITSGSVTVAGGAVNTPITFTTSGTPTYTVTFTETGLPSGTMWLAYLNGTMKATSSTKVSFSEPNGTYPFGIGGPSNYAPSPSSGTVTVNGAGQDVNVTFTQIPYSVTFTESGLPSGTPWHVTMNKTYSPTNSTQDVFYVNNGTFNYTVGNVTGYMASPSSGQVLVKGHNVTVPVTFVAVSPGTYVVTFSESGLPSGTSWSVTLNGATMSGTGNVVFTEPNGSYTFTVGAISGFSASPSSGSVTVNGIPPPTVSITFTPSTSATYAVTFSESGLPSGNSWSVTLSGSSKSGTGSLAFTEPNGTYSFSVGAIAGYSMSPMSGPIKVNGAEVSQSITFTALTAGQYSLIFSETRLPAGTNWSVTVGSTTHSSTGSTISFAEVNGTYHYTVGAITGYTSSPSSGSVTVNGVSKTVSITFAKVSTGATYTVTFMESGLPAGTRWSVTLNGSTKTSTTTTVTFNEPNGTYSFTVGPVSGYTSNPSSGSIRVSGTPLSQSVTFASSSSKGKTNQTTGFLGLPGYDGYIVVGVAVAAVATVAGVILMRKRTPPHGSAVKDPKNIADGAAKAQAVE